MSDTRAVRRRPVSAYLVILLALSTLGVLYAAFAPSGNAQSNAAAQEDLIAEGNQLYLQGCSTCHGLKAQGTGRTGPNLVGVGAAAVDFQVGTGRMPLALRGPQTKTKEVRYSQHQIDALAAYIESLGGGPEAPAEAELDTADANLAEGGELFRTNCASCHNFTGEGGALTFGRQAPDLRDTTPKHIYEAMMTGPGNMPVFGDRTLTPEQKRDILAYIETIRDQPDPGGFGLGRLGPSTETVVAFLVGMGSLVAAAMWIGAKAR